MLGPHSARSLVPQGSGHPRGKPAKPPLYDHAVSARLCQAASPRRGQALQGRGGRRRAFQRAEAPTGPKERKKMNILRADRRECNT